MITVAGSLKCTGLGLIVSWRSNDGFPLTALHLNEENLSRCLLPLMAEKYLASKATKYKKQWL